MNPKLGLFEVFFFSNNKDIIDREMQTEKKNRQKCKQADRWKIVGYSIFVQMQAQM